MTHATGKPSEHIPVTLLVDDTSLSPSYRIALASLSEAVRMTDRLYLRQRNQEYLLSTGGPFSDQSGNAFWPNDLTREELDRYLEQHPRASATLLAHNSLVIRRKGRLVAVPYAKAYKDECEVIAQKLEEAAAHTSHQAFHAFLLGRAAAFRTNAFIESDREWVVVTGAPLELIIGPFEVYDDTLRGVKRYFEGLVGITLPKENADIALYQDLARVFDAKCGRKLGYAPNTKTTPMTVVDIVALGGGAHYGFVAMACNLPDDPEIHREVGSKQTYFRNVVRAKFDHIVTPIARRILKSEWLGALDFSLYFTFLIGHELSHGIGFKFGEDFFDLGSPLEEAKADIFGLLFLAFLEKEGILQKGSLEKTILMHAADLLRQTRFGLEEAHAVGAIIQYNWLAHAGTLRFTGEGVAFSPEMLHSALDSLSKELFMLANSRDHVRAKEFVEKWGKVPEEMRRAVESLSGIPVDIDPTFV